MEYPHYYTSLYPAFYLKKESWFDGELFANLSEAWAKRRLRQSVLREIRPAAHVFQAGCAGGEFDRLVAANIGDRGSYHIRDISDVQVQNDVEKLAPWTFARLSRGDVEQPVREKHDVTLCPFLLQELPDGKKRRVVDNLLKTLKPGGKCVFIDYHKPKSVWNPWYYLYLPFLRLYRPFAESLFKHEISAFATDAKNFKWQKQLFAGGIIQKTVATDLRPTV